MALIREPWNEPGHKLTDDKIRIMLKTAYFSYNLIGISVSSSVDTSISFNFDLDEDKKIKCFFYVVKRSEKGSLHTERYAKSKNRYR